MSVSTEVANLIARAKDPGRALTPQRVERIVLYSGGLEAKMNQAMYALQTIKNLSSSTPQAGTTGYFSDFDRMHFYSDSFWSFGRAALDVLAQVINQTENLNLDEKRCDFATVLNTMQARDSASPLTALLSQLANTSSAGELDDYRNCSLHRRQVYLEYQQTLKIYTTPGYATSPANSTGSVVSHDWYLCDNPLDVIPHTTSNRTLHDYCKTLYVNLEAEVKTLVNSLLP
jgi:hypothetical protein